MARNPTWSRDELILALDLYLRDGFLDDRHPEVIELSALLNRLAASAPTPTFRNPNGVSMKLGNFRSLDPSHTSLGLPRIGRGDAAVWDEFTSDRARLAAEASEIRSRALATPRPGGERRFWALAANPDVYRVEDAVRSRLLDVWTTHRSDLRSADLVAIWKTLGRGGGRRGMIAFGEVMSDPRPRDDAANPFWVNSDDGAVTEPRVEVRYVIPPRAPLWLGDPGNDILGELTVSRGQGSVFTISPDQWLELVGVAGGWPEESAEIVAAEEAVADQAGRPTVSQRFLQSPAIRRTIEDYAMAEAERYYRDHGWNVQNVALYSSYDFHCTKPNGSELHVEVKGTQSDGSQILLTRNEVLHARAVFPRVALFILAGVEVTETDQGRIECGGGTPAVIEPWSLHEESLTAPSYQYRV